MSNDDFLCVYGGNGTHKSKGFVRVPEGMTVDQFEEKVGNSYDHLENAIRLGNYAAKQGDVERLDKELTAIMTLCEEYSSKGLQLRGIPGFKQFLMKVALNNYLVKGKPKTESIERYASKYNLSIPSL